MKTFFFALGLLAFLTSVVLANESDTERELQDNKQYASGFIHDYGEPVGFYNGTLLCPGRLIFCATVLYELKIGEETNYLGTVPLHCTETGKLVHNMMVVFDQHKKIAPSIRIWHNCGQMYHPGEQNETLGLPQDLETLRYTVTLNKMNEIPQAQRLQKSDLPDDQYTHNFINGGETVETMRALNRVRPVVIRNILQNIRFYSMIPSFYTPYRRCVKTSFNTEEVLCSKTHYSYDGNRSLGSTIWWWITGYYPPCGSHGGPGIKFGSAEDQWYTCPAINDDKCAP